MALKRKLWVRELDALFIALSSGLETLHGATAVSLGHVVSWLRYWKGNQSDRGVQEPQLSLC